MAREYTPHLELEIRDMRQQHSQMLINYKPLSLRKLFSTTDCDIAYYCRDFSPNQFGDIACEDTKQFCIDYDIWLEANGDHYNSMTPYLHPGAITAERMTIIGIYNAILFYMNDTVGREKFGHLTPIEQKEARIAIKRMFQLLETRELPPNPSSMEEAVIDFLGMLDRLGDAEWLDNFIDLTLYHLQPAIQDQNARAQGELLSIQEYIDLRNHVSGMYPAIAMCEFGSDNYLRWDQIETVGLTKSLRQMIELTAEIGALMNDVFSFEKECIVDQSDFNLVAACFLNNPGWSLERAIYYAADIVRDMVTEFRELETFITNRCQKLQATNPELAKSILIYVDDLIGSVQATWVWQNVTMRYKGNSVFEENRIS